MAETNVCIKAGRTVRHECSTQACELDDPETIQQEVYIWKAIGYEHAAEEAQKKLRVALERAGRA